MDNQLIKEIDTAVRRHVQRRYDTASLRVMCLDRALQACTHTSMEAYKPEEVVASAKVFEAYLNGDSNE